MMTRTFEEMAAQRDPLYAAMEPQGAFAVALKYQDKRLVHTASFLETVQKLLFFAAVNELTIRALRNQGQPYYRV